MQQIIDLWLGLDGRRRATIVITTLAVFAAVVSLSRLVNTPSYSLLYSGLEAGSAGEVVQALEQRGAAYEVRGGSIFVDTTKRDQLRMTLASEGLPMMSGQGYELLDTLSGFGTTAQMFDAAYWRAKEGELARTIQASSFIRSARVHIANATNQPFRPSASSSASVTAISSAGSLSVSQAQAMRYLVASAVAGLSPEQVSVIDGRTGAVISGDTGNGVETSATDRAAEMKRNVERLLEARVGAGKAIVEINVETNSEKEVMTERLFDPEGRVAISSETEESSSSASDTGSGGVTVASNLPEGDAAGGEQNSNSQDSTTRETLNFEVSETLREVVRAPGAIKRVTTAVLVDGISAPNPETGEIEWQARPDEELAALRELVASAIGFDESRGDSLTIKSMQLTLPIPAAEPATPSIIQTLNLDIMRLIQIAVLAIVSLVLGLFVLRPLFSRPLPASTAALAPPASGALGTNADEGAEPGALPALPKMAMGDFGGMGGDGALPMNSAPLPQLGAPVSGEDPVERLKKMIEDRQDESVEILQNWMQNEQPEASK